MPRSEPLNLQPVSFYTPLSEIDFPLAIEFDGEERPVIARVKKISDRSVELSVQSQVYTHPHGQECVPSEEVGEALVDIMGKRPLRAFAISEGTVKNTMNRPRQILGGVLTFGFGILFYLLKDLATTVAMSALIGFLLAAGIFSFGWWVGSAIPRTQTWVTDAGRYPFTELLADRPGQQAATQQINDLKDHYAELVSDIVYRIENPALFDPAVPTTMAFTEALLEWDSAEATMEASERSALAARVQVTYATARAHAQEVGINHVPEQSRDSVGRAAKAVRLALDTKSPAEREAALKRAMAILESLRLYYMPTTDDALAVTGGKTRLALPGRRRDDAS